MKTDRHVQLMQRYGARYGKNSHNYGLLTDTQVDFLLSRTIAENQGPSGERSVNLVQILEEEGHPVVELWDINYWTFAKNSTGVLGYKLGRIEDYKRVLGTTEDPVDLGQGRIRNKYEFTLPDQSKVRVEYDSMKDSA